jgi:pyrimidine deaminase RibD-like protein
MTHKELMRRAVELACQCDPADPQKTPRLGVVIARNGVIIGEAYRRSGRENDDDHAEVIAVGTVLNQSQIPGSTVYTTLEPCTHHVRRLTSESCTDFLIKKRVAKVVIGILDPNQGVCGRGVNQLQDAGISVQLFPLTLAQQIRLRNTEFILAQQAISPRIISPQSNEVIMLEERGEGWFKSIDVEFECNNAPGPDVQIVVQNGGELWPQRRGISQIANSRLWKGTVDMGAAGYRTIHIVRANPIGRALLAFHQDVIDRNEKRKRWLEEKFSDKKDKPKFWSGIPGDYQPINMPSFPNGIDSLANVTVQFKKPDGSTG